VPLTYEAPDGRTHAMVFSDPHRQLEPLEREIAVVDAGLAALHTGGILPHTRYDHARMLAHRAAMAGRMEIPWTAITPRMQRLLYAINAIVQPQVMIAVGVFCGFTYMSNAGAAIGPGAAYRAQRLVGIEILTDEADRARRNVERFREDHAPFPAEILGVDGLPWLEEYDPAASGLIDLLYLDANDPNRDGKSIYLKLLQAAEHALRPGALILAHNSVNCAEGLADYLAYVRNPAHCRASANMIVDDQGLEVSLI
jgi:predicted O-methyltransferase YrrM